MKTYTKSEMLQIWRTALGLNIKRTDCSIEEFDGLDLDSLISRRMRLWYLNLLDTAPPELLPTAEHCFAAEVKNRRMHVALPENCRRTVGASIDSRQAELTGNPAYVARLSSNYTRPMAVVLGRSITAGPCAAGAQLSVTAVFDPGENSYILDESLLSSIPSQL